jgi:hypothetical protein
MTPDAASRRRHSVAKNVQGAAGAFAEVIASQGESPGQQPPERSCRASCVRRFSHKHERLGPGRFASSQWQLTSGRERTPGLPPSGHGFLPSLEGATHRGLRLPSSLWKVAIVQHSVHAEAAADFGSPALISGRERVLGLGQNALGHERPFPSSTFDMTGTCQFGLSSTADPWGDHAAFP